MTFKYMNPDYDRNNPEHGPMIKPEVTDEQLIPYAPVFNHIKGVNPLDFLRNGPDTETEDLVPGQIGVSPEFIYKVNLDGSMDCYNAVQNSVIKNQDPKMFPSSHTLSLLPAHATFEIPKDAVTVDFPERTAPDYEQLCDHARLIMMVAAMTGQDPMDITKFLKDSSDKQ